MASTRDDLEKAAAEPLMKEKNDDDAPVNTSKESSSRNMLIDGFCIFLNTVCTVGLVFLNKK